MTAPTTVPEAILQNALGPKEVERGGKRIEQHDLDQLIKADRHLAGQTAANRSHLGIRFVQLIPPGAGGHP